MTSSDKSRELNITSNLKSKHLPCKPNQKKNGGQIKLRKKKKRNFSPNWWSLNSCAGPEGGQGVLTPNPENHENIGFLYNTGPDPLKNHKANKPAFNVGPS